MEIRASGQSCVPYGVRAVVKEPSPGDRAMIRRACGHGTLGPAWERAL